VAGKKDPFERVSQVKNVRAEQAANRFAVKEGERRMAEEALEKARRAADLHAQAVAAVRAEVAEAADEGIRAWHLALAESFDAKGRQTSAAHARECDSAGHRLSQLEAETEESRRELAEARKDVRIVERAKETWEKAEARRQERLTDEEREEAWRGGKEREER
jgi:hypothetical protein